MTDTEAEFLSLFGTGAKLLATTDRMRLWLLTNKTFVEIDSKSQVARPVSKEYALAIINTLLNDPQTTSL